MLIVIFFFFPNFNKLSKNIIAILSIGSLSVRCLKHAGGFMDPLGIRLLVKGKRESEKDSQNMPTVESTRFSSLCFGPVWAESHGNRARRGEKSVRRLAELHPSGIHAQTLQSHDKNNIPHLSDGLQGIPVKMEAFSHRSIPHRIETICCCSRMRILLQVHSTGWGHASLASWCTHGAPSPLWTLMRVPMSMTNAKNYSQDGLENNAQSLLSIQLWLHVLKCQTCSQEAWRCRNPSILIAAWSLQLVHLSSGLNYYHICFILTFI